jgi:hypothetical protein
MFYAASFYRRRAVIPSLPLNDEKDKLASFEGAIRTFGYTLFGGTFTRLVLEVGFYLIYECGRERLGVN